MTSDTVRPRLHLTPRRGWINDPLGLTFHDGSYHLFFQYVPDQTVWGPSCHWGHATSPDLLHWTERAPALRPGQGDDGVWSGSIATPQGEPAVLFYTSVSTPEVDIGRARTARPTDDSWTSWTKGDVVAELPAGVEAVAFRDPFVLHDGERWLMLMGAGLTDGTATALVYTSPDLRTWSYDGPLAGRRTDDRDPVWTGSVWECPQLFPLDGRWVLVVSVWESGQLHYGAYAVGTLQDGRFTADSWSRMTYGPSYYAGSTFVDADGRRGLVHWLRGVSDPAGAWASATSLPHMLRLEGDRLVAEPHAGVTTRRTAGPVLGGDDVTASVPSVADLEWTLSSPDGPAQLLISSPAGRPLFTVTAAGGTLTATVGGQDWSMPLVDGAVRLVLDGPVCEVFTTAGVLAFPMPSGTDHVEVALSGDARLAAFALD